MKAITVRQPWAWAILYGGKDVENRTRNIAGAYRGPIVIHAALARDDDGWVAKKAALLADRARKEPLRLAVALGVVDLVEVHLGHKLVGCRYDGGAAVSSMQPTWCSEWADKDAVHLAVTDALGGGS